MRSMMLLLLAAVLATSGCRTWREVPRLSGTTGPLPATARVVKTSGERITLAGGQLSRDSVVGTSAAGRVAVPRDSVARVEERRPAWGRSIALFLAFYLGMAFVISGPEVFTGPSS